MIPIFSIGLDQLRFIQELSATSGADAVFIDVGEVPLQRAQIIMACSYTPSAAETVDVALQVVSRAGNVLTLQNDTNQDLTADVGYGFRRCLLLLPGENLRARRSAAVLGSTMTIRYTFLEIGVPALTVGGFRKKTVPEIVPVADEPPGPMAPERPGDFGLPEEPLLRL